MNANAAITPTPMRSVWLTPMAATGAPDADITIAELVRWHKTGNAPAALTQAPNIVDTTRRCHELYSTMLAAYGEKRSGTPEYAAYTAAKDSLPGAMLSGVATARADAAFAQGSAVVMLDFDGVPTPLKAAELRAIVGGWRETELAKVTASNHGIHAAIRVDPNFTTTDEYKLAWTAAYDMARDRLRSWFADIGVDVDNARKALRGIDSSASNVGRYSFIAHDPDAVHTPYGSAISWEARRKPYGSDMKGEREHKARKRKDGAAQADSPGVNANGLNIDALPMFIHGGAEGEERYRWLQGALLALGREYAEAYRMRCYTADPNRSRLAEGRLSRMSAWNNANSALTRMLQLQADYGWEDPTGVVATSLTASDYAAALNYLIPTPETAEAHAINAHAAGLPFEIVGAWASQMDAYKPADFEALYASLDANPSGNAAELIQAASPLGYKTPNEHSAAERVEAAKAMARDYSASPYTADSIEAEATLISRTGAAYRLLRRAGDRIAIVRQPAHADNRGDMFIVYWRDDFGVWRQDVALTLATHTDANSRYIQGCIEPAFDAQRRAAESNSARAKAHRERERKIAAVRDTETTAYIAQLTNVLTTYANAGKSVGGEYDWGAHLLDHTQMDADTRYIGCANGVVDLITGELLTPTEGAKHYITHSTGVEYKPGARHRDVDVVLAFPSVIPGLRRFALDSLAWTLRGKPSKRFYSHYQQGIGDGGKTTALKAVMLALGEYAASVSPYAYQMPKAGENTANAQRYEFAKPKRFVYTPEAGSEGALHNEPIKALTGGDPVKARRNHENERQIMVTASAHLSSNSSLGGRSHDKAWFARLMPILYRQLPARLRLDPANRHLDAAFDDGNDPEVKARREALLALLVKASTLLDAPPAENSTLRALRQSLAGAAASGLEEWLALNYEETHNPKDKVSTQSILTEARAADVVKSDTTTSYISRCVRKMFGCKSQAIDIDGEKVRGLQGLAGSASSG